MLAVESCEWVSTANLVVFPRLVKYPTNLSVTYLSKTPLWQVQSCQSCSSRINVWNILSYFFMYVSVSNLHFPQMKLASEKPPEAVLEGVILKFSWGSMPPDPPTVWRALHAIPHPLWTFSQTGFFLLPTACKAHT